MCQEKGVPTAPPGKQLAPSLLQSALHSFSPKTHFFPWSLHPGKGSNLSFLARPGCISVGFRLSNAAHPHVPRV